MPSRGKKFGVIGDLVNGNESDSKGAGGSRLAAFVAGCYPPEAMEIAPSTSLNLPLTFVRCDVSAFAEHAIVVDDQGIGPDIELHFVGAVDVVSVLNEFVRETSIPGEPAQVGPELTKVVDVPRKEGRFGHQAISLMVQFQRSNGHAKRS